MKQMFLRNKRNCSLTTKLVNAIKSGAVLLFIFGTIVFLDANESFHFLLGRVHARLFFNYNQIHFQTIQDVSFENLPPEASDPNSQFFGLVYKDTYGLPSEYNKENHRNFYEKFTKDLPSWQEFMPGTAASLSQYFLHNPSGSKDLFTSPTTSSILLTPNKQYTVGDIFFAQIQARDFLKQKKIFGGDYFRAKLMKVPRNKGVLNDGIPCSVEDHLNGTYTISAPLPVAGSFKLEVVLCASIEAVNAYVKWSEGRSLLGYTFEATLISGEITFCNSDLLMYQK